MKCKTRIYLGYFVGKCRARPAFLPAHLTPDYLSSNEKVSGNCIYCLEDNSSLSSICRWQVDRQEEEQQEDKVMSTTIDWQLPSKVHYTDRLEPQHVNLYSNIILITNESLTGTNLLCSSPSNSLCFSRKCISLNKA